MRRFKLFGVALAVVSAFLAVTAIAALATPEWSVEGVTITTTLRAETEGELILKSFDKETHAHLNDITCKGIFDGTIGPAGKDTVTEVLTLTKEATGEDNGLTSTLSGNGLACEVTFSAGAATDLLAASAAKVWAANLPWTTQLELMADGRVLDVFTADIGQPGYEVEGTSVLGIKVTDLCEGPASTVMLELQEGTPLGVHGEFVENDNARGTCSLGAEAEAVGLGITWDAETDLVRLETNIVNR